MTQARRCLAASALAALGLSGCFLKLPWWESTGWQGPLIEGNKYAAVVQRCEMGPRGISDVIYCDRAFVDHNGKKVDVSELRDRIDAYVPNVPALIPWVKVDHKDGRSPWAPQRGWVPYHLHILTISPLIMLAVPRDNDDQAYCAGHLYIQGCLRTEKFDLAPYWWKLPPKVRRGSFWFSPELDVKPTPLADGGARHLIAAGRSHLELNAQGGVWLISRPSLAAR